MLNDRTELYEDDFKENEYDAVRKHHKTELNDEISWTKMSCAWRDLKGVLCVKYECGSCFKYYEKGSHRPIKYYIETEWSDGSIHHESNFRDEDDLVDSINAYHNIGQDGIICNNTTLVSCTGYVDFKTTYVI